MKFVDDYKRDGYVVIEEAVDPTMFGYDKEEALRAVLRGAHAKSVDTYRLCCRLMAQNVATMAMFLSPWLIEVVRALGVRKSLFLTNPVAHVMADDLWHEGVGAHQDWPALQSGLDTIVAWIPIFDVTGENYPVEVVPGSHLLGLLPNKAAEHISEIDTTGMDFVPVPVRRGSVLLFSAFTVHRTRTPGKGFRAAFSHRYENGEDPTFIARGCPSAQRRVIERGMKWQPSAEQVRGVFQ